jgi:hypothetical protein
MTPAGDGSSRQTLLAESLRLSRPEEVLELVVEIYRALSDNSIEQARRGTVLRRIGARG